MLKGNLPVEGNSIKVVYVLPYFRIKAYNQVFVRMVNDMSETNPKFIMDKKTGILTKNYKNNPMFPVDPLVASGFHNYVTNHL